jgi:hypothetical protein
MSDRPVLPVALAQIAAGASAEHSRATVGFELPLAAIHAAARCRRVRWQAGVAVAAAVVVGVLVLGGAAAGGLIDREPVPPVESPDSAGWTTDYSLCGGPAPQWDTAAGPFMLLHRNVAADSRALLTIETGTVSTEEGASAVLERVGTTHEVYALDDTGTVVGVLGVPDVGPGDDMVPLTEETVFVTTTAPLFSCAAPDGATRLEAGSYTLSVSRRVEVVIDGVPREARLGNGPFLTIPAAPAADDPDALPAVRMDAEVPECGEPFDPPMAGDPVIAVTLGPTPGIGAFRPSAELDAAFPPGEPFDDVTRPVEAVATLANTLPGGETHRIAEGGVTVILTADGIIVGQAPSSLFSNAADLAPGTSREAVGLALLAHCPDSHMSDTSLPLGAYEAWVLVSLDEDPPSTLLAGPWPLTDTGTPWAEVDESAVPETVPLVEGRVLSSLEHEDGGAWHVTVQVGPGVPDPLVAVRTGLEVAGFSLDGEQTDDTRPLYWYGVYNGDEYLVVVEVSNETGEGFYADYWITRL